MFLHFYCYFKTRLSLDNFSDQAAIWDSVGNNEECSQPHVEYPCSPNPTGVATHTSPTPTVIQLYILNPVTQPHNMVTLLEVVAKSENLTDTMNRIIISNT
ncbi:hypothetical protein Bpfe_006501, partial [Biomphalaria pfeifferi]